MKIDAARLGIAVLLMAVISPMVSADGLGNNEVVFRGEVTGVTVNGEGNGTLFVRMSTVDLRVLINSKTQFEDDDDFPITLNTLARRAETSPVYVEVGGRFSSSGILASTVRVLEPDDDSSFKVRGHITAITTSGNVTEVALLGIRLILTDTSELSWGGVEFPLADLKIGMFVSATGEISTEPPPAVWLVRELKVLAENGNRESLHFEGTVVSYDKSTGVLRVEVAGALENQTEVLVTPATRIDGELTVGAYVRVSGVLNPGLGARATEIEVVPPLELRPDDLKLKVGESTAIIVSLRVPAANKVTVTLAYTQNGVLELPKTSIDIPAGERTATFSVIAKKIGSATIEASADVGKAVAVVRVGELSDDGGDDPDAGEVRLAFAPDHIKMDVGETRDVVLLIKPPQNRPVTVEVGPKEQGDTKVEVIALREFSNGAATLKVTIRALAPGTSLITATLPGGPVGAAAEVLVEIGSKTGGTEKPLELSFRPSHVQLKVGDSRPVELNLSRPAPADIKLALTQAGTALTIPLDAEIKMGQTGTTVKIIGAGAGKSSVTAALPSGMGSGSVTLEAEVKK